MISSIKRFDDLSLAMSDFVKKHKNRADDIIVFHESSVMFYGNIKDRMIDSIYSIEKDLFFVKVWIGNRKGVVLSSFLSDKLFDDALIIAKNGPEMSYHHGIPENAKYEILKNFSEDVLCYDTDKVSKELESALKFFDKLKKKHDEPEMRLSEAKVSYGINLAEIFTSNNNHGIHKSTISTADVSVGSRDIVFSDDLISVEPVNFYSLIEKTFERALLYSGDRKALSDFSFGHVVFSPETMNELLNYGFLPNLISSNIERQRSRFSFSDLRKFEFGKKFSLSDIGDDNSSPVSMPFDLDGSKASFTKLVDSGRLLGCVSDYDSAKHNGFLPTGNASFTEPSFSTVHFSYDFNPIKTFIVIESISGAHSSDYMSGGFSVLVNSAYYTDGNSKVPLRPFMINSNMIDLLNNICSMDRRKVKNTGNVVLGSCAFPKESMSLTEL